MPTPVEVPQRERWARVRFAIIGPVLAAPPPDGELQAALAALAAKTRPSNVVIVATAPVAADRVVLTT
jgi:hypothetical protein